jgi:hypothetical protein
MKRMDWPDVTRAIAHCHVRVEPKLGTCSSDDTLNKWFSQIPVIGRNLENEWT